MKYDILNSIKIVVENAKHVKINENNIKSIMDFLSKSERKPWLDDSYLDVQKTTIEEKIIFMLLCESLNFCYIGEPKWKIEFNGTMYSGSYGLFYGIAKSIKQGHKLYNIDYLKELAIGDFNSILKGTREIPLLKERYDILKKLVEEIECIENVYELFLKANNDQELLSIIVNNFSNFRDISIYDNKEVYFFKRATLLVEDLYQNIDGIRIKIKSNNGLFGCADYKIPQVLRHFGVLEYSEELEAIVDNEQELEHDSKMEVEIRASMIYAIELIKEQLNNNGINMNSIEIDNALWLLSKDKNFKEKSKPHHLTYNIFY